jgi:hypothetical protein
MNRALVVTGIAVLLLLGCVGGRAATYTQPKTPSPAQPGGSIGDKDLSTGSEKEEDVVPGEDILPPPDDSVASGNNRSILVDLNDVTVDDFDDSDPISDELIVGPN